MATRLPILCIVRMEKPETQLQVLADQLWEVGGRPDFPTESGRRVDAGGRAVAACHYRRTMTDSDLPVEHGCTCRLHPPVDPGDDWDDGDRKLVRDVVEHGWHVVKVGSPDGSMPWWCYTVGLHHSFSVPDLVMAGLGPDGMHHWLNEAAPVSRDRGAFPEDAQLDGVLEGFTLLVRDVAPGWAEPLFGWGRWFARAPEPPIQQLVWPDPQHRMPWDEDATEGCRVHQARLWLPPNEHPSGVWTDWAAGGLS